VIKEEIDVVGEFQEQDWTPNKLASKARNVRTQEDRIAERKMTEASNMEKLVEMTLKMRMDERKEEKERQREMGEREDRREKERIEREKKRATEREEKEEKERWREKRGKREEKGRTRNNRQGC